MNRKHAHLMAKIFFKKILKKIQRKKVRLREKKRNTFHPLAPFQMATIVTAGPDLCQELHLSLLRRWQVPKYFGHLLLLFPAPQLGAGLEPEQPKHKSVPRGEAGTAGSSFTSYITAPSLTFNHWLERLNRQFFFFLICSY